MRTLKVAFLWHMHQPYYFDAESEKFIMPWVRLHSLRGYYDMVQILTKFPDIKLNFNLVPSLLIQIEKYIYHNKTDKYFELSMKKPEDLTEQERVFILKNFFAINEKKVIKRYSRYNELFEKCGKDIDISLKNFSNQDIMDLQVWFNLAWCGFSLINNAELIQKLIKKQKNFTQHEKEELLLFHIEVMKKIIPLYKEFNDTDQIEIAFSPFYHPILPLIYDNKVAQKCMPDVVLPEKLFSAPEDAETQILKSIEYYKQIFNKPLYGVWPSEASVSYNVVKLLAQSNIKWIATDEKILFNTIGFSNEKYKTLYKPYRMKFNEKAINIFFRDKILSDNISFKYSQMEASESVEDIHKILSEIYKNLDNDNHIITIALDGENVWEYFSDSGEKFLSNLYSMLTEAKEFETTTFSDYLSRYREGPELKNIYPGSWINADFDIWIGAKEENRAWSLLSKTREFLINFIKSNPDFSQEKIREAWEKLYQAEGSDWFWWFDDDFPTDHKEVFDSLFRTHLKTVYRILGTNPPTDLNIPVSSR